MQDVRVGAVQLRARVGAVDENLGRTREFVDRACDSGAQIVCFPELNITGYWQDRRLGEVAQAIPGPISDAVVAMASDTGVSVLAGMAELGSNGVVYNTHLVASPTGLLGKYRKTHVSEQELAYFSAGAHTPVFVHPLATVGVEICYDAHFPELSTALALAGCEVLFFPHASGTEMSTTTGVEHEDAESKRARWLRYMPARAYDNAVFVVACNHTGNNGGGQVFPGVTLILNPLGEVIAESVGDEEQIVVADLDAALLKRVRGGPPVGFFLHHRRPALYESVAERP